MMFMLSVFGLAIAAGMLGGICGLAVGIEAERKRRPSHQKDEEPCVE